MSPDRGKDKMRPAGERRSVAREGLLVVREARGDGGAHLALEFLGGLTGIRAR